MNWIAVISLFLAFSTLVYTDDEKTTDAVLELTNATFEDAIKNNDVIMVKFFAPGCAHCKAFAPEYQRAARIIKDMGKTYVLAEMDATVHTSTADKYEIQSYPTVKLFIKGHPTDFEGERKAESVVGFIERIVGPASRELNADQLREKKSAKGLRVSFCFLVTFLS